jgi:hypothetical protein
MCRSFIMCAASAAVLTFSAPVFAQQNNGTADEAKAMLLKAVAALKADKAKTLDQINHGKGGFLDRDLYVFCINIRDGKLVAVGNPTTPWHGLQNHKGRQRRAIWPGNVRRVSEAGRSNN